MLLQGVFKQRQFLDLVRHFIVFQDLGDDRFKKRISTYFQFDAANAALFERQFAALSVRRSAVEGNAENRVAAEQRSQQGDGAG